MLDPLHGRLLSQGELFGSSMWCLWFDCSCHVDFLALVVTPVAETIAVAALLGWLRPQRAKPASQFILDYLPQHSFSPSATLMLSTPSTFLSVTSATPVS
jgi:hypothetical protein